MINIHTMFGLASPIFTIVPLLSLSLYLSLCLFTLGPFSSNTIRSPFSCHHSLSINSLPNINHWCCCCWSWPLFQYKKVSYFPFSYFQISSTRFIPLLFGLESVRICITRYEKHLLIFAVQEYKRLASRSKLSLALGKDIRKETSLVHLPASRERKKGEVKDKKHGKAVTVPTSSQRASQPGLVIIVTLFSNTDHTVNPTSYY